MKKKLLAFSIASAMIAGAAAAVALSATRSLKEAKAETVTISDLDSFKAVFDKGAGANSKDIELTADIDVSSYLGTVANGGQCGMAGTYQGTFNGNGHMIYGIGTTGGWGANCGGLFNIVGEDAIIKDLIIDWEAPRDNVGSIGYLNNGTMQNVTVITHVGAANPNSFGAFFAQTGGTSVYKNCYSHFINTGTRGGAVGTVSFGGTPGTVKDCYYSDTIVSGGAAALSTQDFESVTLKDQSFEVNKEISVGDSFVADTYGLPLKWTSGDSSKVSVSGNVITGEVTDASPVTVSGALPQTPVDLKSVYGTFSTVYNVTVVSAATPVTGVSVAPNALTLTEGDSAEVTVSLTGTGLTSAVWTVNNDGVASVIGDSESATITAGSAGNATVTLTVTSTNTNTYTATVAVTVVELQHAALPLNAASEYAWGGAGLQKVYVTTASLPSTNKADYTFEATCSGALALTLVGWQFDDVIDDHTRLYTWYNAAPTESSGVYTLHFTLTTKSSPKTAYEADIVFDGLTRVIPAATISGAANVAVGGSETYSVTPSYFTPDTYTWSVSDSSVADIDSTTASSVALNGISEGTVVLSVSVVGTDGKTYNANKTISVDAVLADITDFDLVPDNVNVLEGKSTTINVENMVGSQYISFAWSSDDSTVASVTGNLSSATVVGGSAGTATIELAIVTSSGTVSKTAIVTVSAARYVDIYFAIKDGFSSVTNYGVFFYGGHGTDGATALLDTGYDLTISEEKQSLYLAHVNLDALDKMNGENIYDGVYLQFCNTANTGQRWGSGFSVSSLNGYVLTANWADGSKAYTNLGTAADMADVLDYCVDYMKADTIPLDDHSETAQCQSNYEAAIAELTNLSADERKLFALTDYYERLQNWAAANGHPFVIDSEGAIQSAKINGFVAFVNDKNNTILLVVIISAFALITTAGLVLVLKRKH